MLLPPVEMGDIATFKKQVMYTFLNGIELNAWNS